MNEKILTVSDITNMSQEQLSEMYRQGYTLEGAIQKSGCQSCKSTETLGVINNRVETLDIKALANTVASCPPSVYRTETRNIKVDVSATNPGYGPYAFYLLIGPTGGTRTQVARYPPVSNRAPAGTTSYTFMYDFGSLAPGSYDIEGMVEDDCPGAFNTGGSICTVNVLACPLLEANMTILA